MNKQIDTSPLGILTSTVFYAVTGVYNEATTLTFNLEDGSPLMDRFSGEIESAVGPLLMKFEECSEILRHAYPRIRNTAENIVLEASKKRPGITLRDVTDSTETLSEAVLNDVEDEYVITGYSSVGKEIVIDVIGPMLELLKRELNTSQSFANDDYLKRLLYGVCLTNKNTTKVKVSSLYRDHERYLHVINMHENTTVKDLFDDSIRRLPSTLDILYSDLKKTDKLYADTLAGLLGDDLPANHSELHSRTTRGKDRGDIFIPTTTEDLTDSVSHITNTYNNLLSSNTKTDTLIKDNMGVVVSALRSLSSLGRLSSKNVNSANEPIGVFHLMLNNLVDEGLFNICNDGYPGIRTRIARISELYLNRMVVRYNEASAGNGGCPNDQVLKQFAIELIMLIEDDHISHEFLSDLASLYLSDINVIHEWYYQTVLGLFIARREEHSLLHYKIPNSGGDEDKLDPRNYATIIREYMLVNGKNYE